MPDLVRLLNNVAYFAILAGAAAGAVWFVVILLRDVFRDRDPDDRDPDDGGPSSAALAYFYGVYPGGPHDPSPPPPPTDYPGRIPN